MIELAYVVDRQAKELVDCILDSQISVLSCEPDRYAGASSAAVGLSVDSAAYRREVWSGPLMYEGGEDDMIATPESQRGWFGECMDALRSFAELPVRWDSYNARPVDQRRARMALALMQQLLPSSAPVPQVVPTVRGGIQLEWDRGDKHLEIDLTEFPFVEYAFEDESTDEYEERVAFDDFRQLASLIKRTVS